VIAPSRRRALNPRTHPFRSSARALASSSVAARASLRASAPSSSSRRPLFAMRDADAKSSSRDAAPSLARSLRVGVASGACAGVACQLALFPLNTLKTRSQAGGRLRADRLYGGIAAELLGAAPGTALFMSAYECATKTMRLSPAIAAALGALASSAVLAPMELIARRMQVSRLSLATAARLSARRGELFAGFGSFLARELPFDTIQMTAFEAMKRATLAIEGATDASGKKKKKKKALGKRQTAIIGGVAGGVTGLVTTPFDVCRTAEVCASSMGIDLKTHPKGLAGVKRLKERFGMSFFFRGAAPRALEIGLGGVIYFSVIETARRYFESSSRETNDDAKLLKTAKSRRPERRTTTRSC